MNIENEFKQRCSSCGLREPTQWRVYVAKRLLEFEFTGAFSEEEAVEAIKEERMTRSSLYRTLYILHSVGMLSMELKEDGIRIFRVVNLDG